MTQPEATTIVARATAPGIGGIGIVRISGPLVRKLIPQLIQEQTVKARVAHYTGFINDRQELIDQGVALFFPQPHSFTGEDVLELQGHGGPVVLDLIIKAALKLGCCLARPGEFSERAFINNKIDLVQAEAIAQLIHANSEQAARSALHSLKGDFSEAIQKILEQNIQLRMYIESSMDFPEEEIEFLEKEYVLKRLKELLYAISQVLGNAGQGVLLHEGIKVAIIGKPNAGKSSLLNLLACEERAIVTDIAGTTRDILTEHIQLDGIPIHLVDTAGIRQSEDLIEQEGIKRAQKAAEQADLVLHLIDISDQDNTTLTLMTKAPIIRIYNKADLVKTSDFPNKLLISAKTGFGKNNLVTAVKDKIGFHGQQGIFAARRRHLTALENGYKCICIGKQRFLEDKAIELLAEELKKAQNFLNEITGQFTADDLLGRIFAEFCIGK